MKHSKQMLQRLMLVAFGCVVGGLLAEVASRVYLALEQRQRTREWNEARLGRVRVLEGPLKLGQIIRASDDPRVIYELIPGLRDQSFRGHPLAINGLGFRGPVYPQERDEGALRIVGIGDSVMFGWELPEADSFLRQLERMLREDEPPIRAEVINLAVPGYNTAMEVAALERVGLAYQPDLVLLHFYENDLDLPNFIAERSRNFLDLTHSFLLGDLLARWVAGSDPPPGAPGIARTPRKMRLASKRHPERVPARYRYMVGIEGHRRAMLRLARLRETYGFEVLVTSHRQVPGFLAEICSELGFRLLAIEPRISGYMAEHGIASYLGSELTVGSGDDPHPSALQSSLIAAAIRDEITSSDWIDR